MKSRQGLFSFIHDELREADTHQAGQWRITPIARSLRIDFPRRSGGIIWNRPAGVFVRGQGEGEARWLPIVDVTRRAQVAIWVGAAAVLLVAWLFSRGRSA